MTSPAPLDCGAVVRQLWDYLDSELDAERWTAIRAHLATCTGCSGHVEFCRSFLTQVAGVPMNTAEVASMRARVLAALETRPPQ